MQDVLDLIQMIFDTIKTYIFLIFGIKEEDAENTEE